MTTMRRLGSSLVVAVCLTTGMSLAGGGAARAAPQAAPLAAPARATVSVDISGPPIGQLVQHFIGLSTESSELRIRAPQLKDTGNFARLLANLGGGVLRFGGESADNRHFTGTTAATLQGLASLVRAAGWSVLYTENLGHFNAARVRADARKVVRALGSNLFAFACGNEPDQFVSMGLRPPGWTAGEYLSEVHACYRAIRSVAPGAPLAGPDGNYHRTLLASFARRDASTIAWYTAHFYPLGCRGLHGTAASLAADMLSAKTATAEAVRFGIYAGIAAIARRPLVLAETSNFCHGGLPRVSNSFASALWVIDYLLTGAEHGVHAMNLSTGFSAACATYTVLCLNGDNVYDAQPVYYGLLLTRMLGTGRLVPVSIRQTPRQHITAFALRGDGGGLRLMVENMNRAAAAVSLDVGSYRGAATAARLRAPALLATSGVTIQGARVAADGTFSPGRRDTLRCAGGGCALPMPGYSAALVTVPVTVGRR
jgi:hypothetical protein